MNCQGIFIFGCRSKKAKSYTGDPVKDMDNVLDFLRKNPQKQDVWFSSSVDHFLMDGEKYTYKYDKNYCTSYLFEQP
jgi:hypothetical protein